MTWDVQYREVVAGTPTDADWRWLAHGTTLTQKQAPGTPGHTYTFRARTLQAGSPGPWSAEVTTVAPYDQETGALFTASYSAGWSTARAASSYLGSMRYASKKGRTATFTFTGRALSVLTQKGPAKGKVQVKVRTQTNGAWSAWTTVKTLDLYNRSTKNRSLVTLKSWPDAATRQAQFLVTGTKNRRAEGHARRPRRRRGARRAAPDAAGRGRHQPAPAHDGLRGAAAVHGRGQEQPRPDRGVALLPHRAAATG